jgi:hypothetical protein
MTSGILLQDAQAQQAESKYPVDADLASRISEMKAIIENRSR